MNVRTTISTQQRGTRNLERAKDTPTPLGMGKTKDPRCSQRSVMMIEKCRWPADEVFMLTACAISNVAIPTPGHAKKGAPLTPSFWVSPANQPPEDPRFQQMLSFALYQTGPTPGTACDRCFCFCSGLCWTIAFDHSSAAPTDRSYSDH